MVPAGFQLFTNPVYITGHLKRNPRGTYTNVGGMGIIVKGNKKTLAHTFADRHGNFKLTFTPGNEKSFDFFVIGVAVDTLLVGSVRTFQNDTPDLTFYVPGIPKHNRLGQTICPICKRADMVYRIRYGDALPISQRHVSEQGDTTYSRIVDGYYDAGSCIATIATYYCDREKVKF